MYRVYCFELAKENQCKAEEILHKYHVNNVIDVKHMEQSQRSGVTIVRYWLTCVCSDEIEFIANELKANGVVLF